MSALAFLAGAHHHHGSTSAQIAAAALALIAAGSVVAAGLVAARWWMQKRGSERRPCPDCGAFLAPGEKCPVCPPEGKDKTGEEAERDASRR